MVWRASLSIAGKQSGLHFIQRAGVRLPASVWHGGAAGLRPIRPERMRTRVRMPRRPAKKPGAGARRRGLVRPLRLDPNLARVRFGA
jgi:hypothetical protein